MKLRFRAIALCLALLTLLPQIVSCAKKKNESEISDTVFSDVNEKLGETSEDGRVEFKLLGVRTVDTFAGITPAAGSSVVCLYVEVLNKTPNEYYVKRTCLDLVTQKLLSPNEALLPEEYDDFGGYVASGKRRLFLVCVEAKKDWFSIPISYDSFDGVKWSESVISSDYKGEKELLATDTSYPLDRRGDEDLLTDFETIRHRFVDGLWGTPSESNAQNFEKLLVTSEKGMCFSNVDYVTLNRARWAAIKHLENLQALLSHYGKERLANDETARKTALGVLDYWLNNDFKSENPYDVAIATPTKLVTCALMLRPYLSEKQLDKINLIVGRGSMKGTEDPALSYGKPIDPSEYTGANLLDVVVISVNHALLLDDCDLALSAVARAAKEIAIVKPNQEGMQDDGSFFQHGALLCSGGSYGSVFARRVSVVIANLYGTVFSLPQKNVETYIDHLLDGQRYFHRGLGGTYFSLGRAAVHSVGGIELKIAVEPLLPLKGLYRSDEIVAYYESFGDPTKSFDSMKYFPRSYSLVNSSPDVYIALRGAHSGFILTEVVNNQNTLGYNLSYGANACYMYYGDEYQAIGAVMDYSMFPGVTTYLETDEQLYQRYTSSYNKTWGRETYKGTHCDGSVNEEKEIGALYMELINDGINGKLSYITYGDTLIALGAGLDLSKSNDKEIRTTIDQSKFNNARIGSTSLAVGSGAKTVNKSDVVYNGAFAYYNLGETVFTAEAKSMTNAYSRTDAGGSSVQETHDVFQLYISHGSKLNDASYAYAVSSNADGNAPKSVADLKIARITNTETIQAVELEDGTAVVIFHAAGEFVLVGGEKLTASAAQIIIK